MPPTNAPLPVFWGYADQFPGDEVPSNRLEMSRRVKTAFFRHLFPCTSLGWGEVCSIREDLLPVGLPSTLRHKPFTILSSAAKQ